MQPGYKKEKAMNNANNFLTADALKTCAGAIELAKRIVDANPMLDESGEVRYYFNGSLSVNLLAACSEYFDHSGAIRTLSDDVRREAAAAVRKMHDVDIVVPLGSHTVLTMPTIGNASSLLGDAFDDDFPFEDLDFDCWPAREDEKLICLDIDGYKIWINHPVEMFTHKFVLALRNFNLNSAKLGRDFDRLYNIARTFESREDLLDGAQRALDLHRPHTLSWFRSHENNAAWMGPLAAFHQSLIARHPEREILARLQFPTRHSIALLMLLGKLSSRQDKELLVKFLNEQQRLVQEDYCSLLDVLNTIAPERLESELICLRILIVKDAPLLSLAEIMAKLKGDERRQLLTELEAAAQTLSPQRFHFHISQAHYEATQMAA
jgi:hypothetical protein